MAMAVNEAKQNGLALKVVWTEGWREACVLKIERTLITQVDSMRTSLNAGWTSRLLQDPSSPRILSFKGMDDSSSKLQAFSQASPPMHLRPASQVGFLPSYMTMDNTFNLSTSQLSHP